MEEKVGKCPFTNSDCFPGGERCWKEPYQSNMSLLITSARQCGAGNYAKWYSLATWQEGDTVYVVVPRVYWGVFIGKGGNCINAVKKLLAAKGLRLELLDEKDERYKRCRK